MFKLNDIVIIKNQATQVMKSWEKWDDTFPESVDHNIGFIFANFSADEYFPYYEIKLFNLDCPNVRIHVDLVENYFMNIKDIG